MTYFVIRQDEDSLKIEQLDGAELLERLNSDLYGTNILDKISSRDTDDWNIDDTVIIKGTIVTTRLVQVTDDWNLVVPSDNEVSAKGVEQ